MDVVVELEQTSPKTLLSTQNKDTGPTRAECLRMAVSWPGMGLTVLGAGALSYGLYASAPVLLKVAAGLGGPGIFLVSAVVVSYCCCTAENNEDMALLSHNGEGMASSDAQFSSFQSTESNATIISNGDKNPTAIPPTTGESKQSEALQEWLASQPDLEKQLKSRNPQTQGVTSDAKNPYDLSETKTTHETTITANLQKAKRRETNPNPKAGSRDPRVRSGEQAGYNRSQPSRVRTTSDAGTRGALNTGNNTNSESQLAQLDSTSELERQHRELKEKYDQSRSSVKSNSDFDS